MPAAPKNLRTPDESVRLPGVDEDIVHVGDEMVARIVQYPGWRWTTDMRGIAGGDLCETHHVGVTMSGRQGALLRDGTVLEFGPDDVYDIPPGHDGYTIGDEPCVLIEWSGARTWAGRAARHLDRALLSLLVTDVVESTAMIARVGDAAWQELIGRHVGRARAQLEVFRGTEIDLAGDGLLASFDSPARAIRFALAIRGAANAEGLHVRTGVHVGEVEIAGERVRGLAVHETARIAAAAAADEILVSETTRGLVARSNFRLRDRGLHELKGIPDEMRLFAVDEAAAAG